MQLHNLKPNAGSTHSKKRVGRGTGSGTGKTAGFAIPMIQLLCKEPPKNSGTLETGYFTVLKDAIPLPKFFPPVRYCLVSLFISLISIVSSLRKKD